MADTITKPKLQLRSGASFNGDKTPSPATKLLINHGKPNFTIQRSPKVQQNGVANPLSPQPQPQVSPKALTINRGNNNDSTMNNNNDIGFKNANGSSEIVVQSTKFNGVFKPANIFGAPRQPHQVQQQSAGENEASKVVLRRTRVKEEPIKENEDDSVPEFIRRQRRIQERLAKDNLDFESRRSGYFTHVLISPSSVNRQSFAETMSSPAIVPSLEIQPPLSPAPAKRAEQGSIAEESSESDAISRAQLAADEEEEVAKAIEEVNKAVAGEDDEKETLGLAETVVKAETVVLAQPAKVEVEIPSEAEHKVEETAVAVTTSMEHVEHVDQAVESNAKTSEAVPEEGAFKAIVAVATVETVEDINPIQNGHDAAEIKENGHAAVEHKENGHDYAETVASKHNVHNEDITISHTNSQDGPSIPTPDPSGALGVNYEPKTIVSFSKDLGSEPNNYPDTVKVTKEDGAIAESDNGDMQGMAKLKFDINTDEEDVKVTSVLKSD